MPGTLTGIAAAVVASILYAGGIAMQASEARLAPVEQALRLSLFRRLVAKPRWLAGTALGLSGWVMQALALTDAPLTVVQPLLGTSLVFLLGLATWKLGETVAATDVLAVSMIGVGAPLLALLAPDRHTEHASGARLWLVLCLLGGLALSPLLLRGRARAASLLVPAGAGLAYAWDSLATKLASDDYSAHLWLGLCFWFVTMNAASALGTLSEMSALQRRPVVQVAPLVFALTTFLPVVLAPFLTGERWPGSVWRASGLGFALLLVSGGGVALARSPAVARTLAAEASSLSSETPRSSRAESTRATAMSESRA